MKTSSPTLQDIDLAHSLMWKLPLEGAELEHGIAHAMDKHTKNILSITETNTHIKQWVLGSPFYGDIETFLVLRNEMDQAVVESRLVLQEETIQALIAEYDKRSENRQSQAKDIEHLRVLTTSTNMVQWLEQQGVVEQNVSERFIEAYDTLTSESIYTLSLAEQSKAQDTFYELGSEILKEYAADLQQSETGRNILTIAERAQDAYEANFPDEARIREHLKDVENFANTFFQKEGYFPWQAKKLRKDLGEVNAQPFIEQGFFKAEAAFIESEVGKEYMSWAKETTARKNPPREAPQQGTEYDRTPAAKVVQEEIAGGKEPSSKEKGFKQKLQSFLRETQEKGGLLGAIAGKVSSFIGGERQSEENSKGISSAENHKISSVDTGEEKTSPEQHRDMFQARNIATNLIKGGSTNAHEQSHKNVGPQQGGGKPKGSGGMHLG